MALVDELLEGPPVFAGELWLRGPFETVHELQSALCDAVRKAGEERKVALIRAHPELAGKAAVAGELAGRSATEQSGAGLDSLSPEEHESLSRMNGEYREKFGFPFVVCARNHTKESILRELSRRLGNTREEEISHAVGEICEITRFRLEDIAGGGAG